MSHLLGRADYIVFEKMNENSWKLYVIEMKTAIDTIIVYYI